ncbi:septal ring lytic transglycosylase RlpA family protein [Halopseudomonas nanhaiensis]|uniref:septal ring lytic transglycosylase RlpA family protein n=1 Tax=Halopseudomonas nanhaiensis TaxID=2830842 RepID=UPI001CBE93CC|nr:septal ring lytic transglycosylase RlpA family protein [Halopseudomonas nanhaiensis]UAW99595.1 septal ring lytic transglycosylase RlpA family protein [Halopseudomonas nanhaiensis]
MTRLAIRLMLSLFIVALVGCSTAPKGSGGVPVGFTETGLASFYADRHQNQKTANGERYSHKLKTAAHKKLPFGSQVRVTNLQSGKSVVVRINDRGPFVRGRIIDLSKSAFSEIGSTSAGLVRVKIEVIR